MQEKRKFMLRVSPEFRALPIPEQSKFIVNLSSPKTLKQPEDMGVIKGAASEIASFAGEPPKTIGESVKQGFVAGIDPTGIVRAGASQLPLIGRSLKEEYEAIRHPLTPQPLQGLHTAEAMVPIAGQMAANLEDKPLGEATGRGIVDIGAIASSEFGRFFKASGVPPEEMTPAQVKDIIGRSVKEALTSADRQLANEVSTHAEHVAKTVDDPARNPIPAIDATAYVKELETAWDKYIATGEKDPSSVIGHRIPPDMVKSVKEAIGSPGGRWTFEQAKQIRSALDEYVAHSNDPTVRRVAIEASKNLRGAMEKAATDAGVGKDFDAYNNLHHNRMDMQRAVLKGVQKAPTGEAVMRGLNRNAGYVQNTVLPSLEKYGLDPKPINDALKATAEGAKAKWAHDWRTRYALGVGVHTLSGGTIPWIAGAAGVGTVGEAIESSAAAREAEGLRSTPSFQRGQEIVKGSVAPGRSELSTPKPIPEPPEPPKPSARPQQKAIGAPPTYEQSTATTEHPEARPEPPHEEEIDRYASSKQRLVYLRTLNSAIGKLARGSQRALDVHEFKWIEEETGLDMTDPENIAKARKILMQKRDKLTKTASAKGKKGMPNPPAKEENPEEQAGFLGGGE
jgi:hypothetical protein